MLLVVSFSPLNRSVQHSNVISKPELDPRNSAITQRLELLKQAQATGAQLPAAPGPQDVHPTAYTNTFIQPPGLTGPPLPQR
jgi:hypothetical protein